MTGEGGFRFDVEILLCRFGNDPAVFANQVGVTHRTVNRWRVEGGVPEEEADHVAIRCGTHPITVWGEAWLDRYMGEYEQPSLFE